MAPRTNRCGTTHKNFALLARHTKWRGTIHKGVALRTVHYCFGCQPFIKIEKQFLHSIIGTFKICGKLQSDLKILKTVGGQCFNLKEATHSIS